MSGKQILKWRIERTIVALRELDIDLWINIGRETHLTTNPTLTYLLPSTFTPTVALVFTKSGDSICICTAMRIEEVEQYGATQTNLVYRTAEEFDNELKRIIQTIPTYGRVALDFSDDYAWADGLSWTQFQRLDRLLDESGFRGEIVSSHALLKSVRAQKSIEEIQGISNAINAALQLSDEFRKTLYPGMSSCHIQRWFQEKAFTKGYEIDYQFEGGPCYTLWIQSNQYGSESPFHVSVKPGDLISIGLGFKVNGFVTDNKRVYYVLRPGESKVPNDLQLLFAAVLKAQQAVASVMRPGNGIRRLNQIANEVFEKHKCSPIIGSVHHLEVFVRDNGIELDSNTLQTCLDTALLDGMILTVELAIPTPNGDLFLGEIMTITSDGAHIIGCPQTEIWASN